MEITREQWLTAAAEKIAPIIGTAGWSMPEKVRYTCGFPSRGGMGKKKRTIGQCWDDSCSKDQTFEILISPTISDPIDVLATLLHEMIHAAVGLIHKHKGDFRKCAKACGLEGKMTATHAGDDLAVKLGTVATAVGVYPHAILEARANSGPDKQGTRMLKVECPACGYSLRTTAKWIEVGLPTCVCGTEMVQPEFTE